jgi:hypothetical protein
MSRLATLGILAAIRVLAACSASTPSATVSAIAVSPSPCAVGRTNSLQMSALATLPDGAKIDISSSPQTVWSTGDREIATVNPMGVMVGVNPGITAITAGFQGGTGSVDCTVGP